MNGGGNPLLSRSTLSIDNQREIGSRRIPDEIEDSLHGEGFALNSRETVPFCENPVKMLDLSIFYNDLRQIRQRLDPSDHATVTVFQEVGVFQNQKKAAVLSFQCAALPENFSFFEKHAFFDRTSMRRPKTNITGNNGAILADQLPFGISGQ